MVAEGAAAFFDAQLHLGVKALSAGAHWDLYNAFLVKELENTRKCTNTHDISDMQNYDRTRVPGLGNSLNQMA